MDKGILDVQKLIAIGGFMIIFLLVLFIILFIYLYQKRFYSYLKETAYLKARFDEELIKTKLEIQEQTFKNISQDIHDNIGQVLSLAKLNLSSMSIDEPFQLQTKIDDCNDLIGKAIKDLRDISHSLNTERIEEIGLSKALEYQLDLTRRAGSFHIEYLVEGNPYEINTQHSLIIFRIVQEALNNIIRHSHATLVMVRMIFSYPVLSLSIADNGVGFSVTKNENADYSQYGLGLKNMYTRAKMINSGFNVTSSEGKGSIIEITYPICK